jgi:hypothetical protein
MWSRRLPYWFLNRGRSFRFASTAPIHLLYTSMPGDQFRLWYLFEGTGIISHVDISKYKQVADLQRAIQSSATNNLCKDIEPSDLILLKVCNCLAPVDILSLDSRLLMSPRLIFFYHPPTVPSFVPSMNGGAQITLKNWIQCNGYVKYGPLTVN